MKTVFWVLLGWQLIVFGAAISLLFQREVLSGLLFWQIPLILLIFLIRWVFAERDQFLFMALLVLIVLMVLGIVMLVVNDPSGGPVFFALVFLIVSWVFLTVLIWKTLPAEKKPKEKATLWIDDPWQLP